MCFFTQKTSKHGRSATPLVIEIGPLAAFLSLLFLTCTVHGLPVLFDTYAGCCFLERCTSWCGGKVVVCPTRSLSIRVAALLYRFFLQSFGGGEPAGGFSCKSLRVRPINTPSTDSFSFSPHALRHLFNDQLLRASFYRFIVLCLVWSWKVQDPGRVYTLVLRSFGV